MTKASMYREPLERYLLIKFMEKIPGLVAAVRVRKLDERRQGCNWEIERIEPSLPAAAAADLDREIVAPLRASIELSE